MVLNIISVCVAARAVIFRFHLYIFALKPKVRTILFAWCVFVILSLSLDCFIIFFLLLLDVRPYNTMLPIEFFLKHGGEGQEKSMCFPFRSFQC